MLNTVQFKVNSSSFVQRLLSVLFLGAVLYVISFLYQRRTRPPHIVFMLADDLGYNDLGYVRAPQFSKLRTPFLDHLARKSLRLKYSYVQPICSASRAALLTGRYPFRFGFQHIAVEVNEKIGLPLEWTVLPEKLQQLGYQTHMVGKWHLGHCRKEYTPLYQGFDTFRGFHFGNEGYYSHLIHKVHYDYWKNEDLLFNDRYSTYDYLQYTIDLIKGNTDQRPMFLYLSMQAPHMPYDPPPGVSVNETDEYKYNRMVETLDTVAQKVFQALEEKGISDDTIFIFSSDNGAAIHGGSNYPLRGFKQDLYEGGTRVRTFIHGPGFSGGDYTGLFHAVDWYPTLVKMAGYQANEELDGVDQFQALLDKENNFDLQPRKSFIYDIYEKDLGNGSILHSGGIRYRFRGDDGEVFDYKYMTGQPEPREREVYQPRGWLYDMRSDMTESKNLYGFQAEREFLRDILHREKRRGYKRRVRDMIPLEDVGIKRNGVKILTSNWC